MRHFPRSHGHVLAKPGTWNQLCLTSRLALFWYHRTFLILSFLFFIAKFSSRKENSAVPPYPGAQESLVVEVF